MDDLTLERLTELDAPSLFVFEKKNKTWFESHVGPRPDSYLTLDGLSAVVMEQVAAGELMYLLKLGGRIIGRVNLTGIDARVAQLGYRLGKDHCGKGLATQAVGMVLEAARAQGLWAIEARVLAGNPASRRVLEKNGFLHTGSARIGDKACDTFRRDLD